MTRQARIPRDNDASTFDFPVPCLEGRLSGRSRAEMHLRAATLDPTTPNLTLR